MFYDFILRFLASQGRHDELIKTTSDREKHTVDALRARCPHDWYKEVWVWKPPKFKIRASERSGKRSGTAKKVAGAGGSGAVSGFEKNAVER